MSYEEYLLQVKLVIQQFEEGAIYAEEAFHKIADMINDVDQTDKPKVKPNLKLIQ